VLINIQNIIKIFATVLHLLIFAGQSTLFVQLLKKYTGKFYNEGGVL